MKMPYKHERTKKSDGVHGGKTGKDPRKLAPFGSNANVTLTGNPRGGGIPNQKRIKGK